jgi:hypothetical protein
MGIALNTAPNQQAPKIVLLIVGVVQCKCKVTDVKHNCNISLLSLTMKVQISIQYEILLNDKAQSQTMKYYDAMLLKFQNNFVNKLMFLYVAVHIILQKKLISTS